MIFQFQICDNAGTQRFDLMVGAAVGSEPRYLLQHLVNSEWVAHISDASFDEVIAAMNTVAADASSVTVLRAIGETQPFEDWVVRVNRCGINGPVSDEARQWLGVGA